MIPEAAPRIEGIECYVCGAQALNICHDCNKYFCDKCKMEHLENDEFKDHRFQDLLNP